MAGFCIALVLMDPAPGRRYKADKAESLGHIMGESFVIIVWEPLGLDLDLSLSWGHPVVVNGSIVAYRSDELSVIPMTVDFSNFTIKFSDS
jgi:hypothetical protein